MQDHYRPLTLKVSTNTWIIKFREHSLCLNLRVNQMNNQLSSFTQTQVSLAQPSTSMFLETDQFDIHPHTLFR